MNCRSCRRMCLFAAMAIIVVAVGPLASAQDEVKEKDTIVGTLESRVAQFLEGVSSGQSRSAFQDLLAGSQLLKQTDALKDLIARTDELEAKYGKYRAFEQVSAKRVGANLVLMRYLYKCESFPVVWHFSFYRTPGSGSAANKNGAWRVVAVRFDTDLDQLQRVDVTDAARPADRH
jgi:hypothetical protein